jgi:hypothetical protein
VKRTAEYVRREYGQDKWPAVEQAIERVLAAEPEADLSRTLRLVAREQWRSDDPLHCAPAIAGGKMVPLPRSAALGAEQAILVEVLIDACTPRTDLIVELGSGWAWHLLSLWCSGGPPAAQYVAAEYTESGRRASERLASLEPRLDFRAVPFDYHDPDLSAVAGAEEAVVFTVSSVEQIPHLDPSLFDIVGRLANRVTCVHSEPVGWQLDGSSIGSSRAYAEEHDYNRDLIYRLREQEEAGELAIDALAPDLIGVNPGNASTVIRWRAGF